MFQGNVVKYLCLCRKTGNRSKGETQLRTAVHKRPDLPMGAYALVVSRPASACGVPRVIPLGIPVASTEHARAPPFRSPVALRKRNRERCKKE